MFLPQNGYFYASQHMCAGPSAVLEAVPAGGPLDQESGVPLTRQLCSLGLHFLIHRSRQACSTLSRTPRKDSFDIAVILLALTAFSYLTTPGISDLDLLCGSQAQNSFCGHSAGQHWGPTGLTAETLASAHHHVLTHWANWPGETSHHLHEVNKNCNFRLLFIFYSP